MPPILVRERMSDDPASSSPPLPVLLPASRVCRLARSKRWLNPDDPSRFLPEAFFRRSNEQGLSVNIEDACHADYVMAMKNADPPLTAHGVAELRVGSIRDLGFGL